MASLMITGGKLGQILGRKRAFAIGCVIYGCGSLTTALSPNLAVLMFGWSFLEGVGAALIMPAIVALVASNFARRERPRAYGLVASAGAIAVAAGPLIGGLFTTYLVLAVGVRRRSARRRSSSWRSPGAWPTPRPSEGARLDLVGTALSALGLGLVVYGILRSGTWGFVQPKPGAPEWLGLSPVIWLILAGGRRAPGLLAVGEPPSRTRRRAAARPGDAAEPGPAGRAHRRSSSSTCCRPGSSSSCRCSSRWRSGSRRSRPACGCCRCRSRCSWPPRASPRSSRTRRRAVSSSSGSSRCSPASCVIVAALDAGAGPEIVTWPMLLAGLGVGALASQLGSVTVSVGPRRAER